MENIIYNIRIILKSVLSFGIPWQKILPNEGQLFSGIIPIVLIFVLAETMIRTKYTYTINKNNEINKTEGYEIYKSVKMAKIVFELHVFASVYMILWNVFFFTQTLPATGILGIIRVIAMGIACVYVILTLIYKRTIGSLDIPFAARKIYIRSGVAMLLCLLTLGAYITEYIALLAVLGCSYIISEWQLTMKHRYSGTMKYLKTKNDYDHHITEGAETSILDEIVQSMPILEAVGGNECENSEILQNLPALSGSFENVPVSYYNNENYYVILEELKKNTFFRCSEDKDWKKELTDTICKCVNENSTYDAELYDIEAINKTFSALGYNGEVSCEHYTKFRKSILALSCAYSIKAKEQEHLWRTSFDSKYPIIANGVKGENVVSKAMQDMVENNPDIKILKGFRFRYADNATAECDLLILSSRGIFCVEVKNYGMDSGYTLEIAANGIWHKRYGDQLHQIDGNPFLQNATHVEALKKRFGSEFAKLTDDGSIPPIHKLVVVPNDIQIENAAEDVVLHIDGLCRYVIESGIVKYDAEKVGILAQTLAKENIPAMKVEQIDFALWKEQIETFQNRGEMFTKLYPQMMLSEKYRNI